MDITKLSIEQLKALAYDESLKIAQAQRNLQIIEAQIAKKESEPKDDKKK